MPRPKPSTLPTPQELGCQRPFALSYRARLRLQYPPDEKELRSFLNAYQAMARELATFLVKWFQGSPAERTAACLLISPNYVPPDVLTSEPWKLVSADESELALPKPWARLVDSTLYQNFRALTGRDERPTKAGAIVQEVWRRFGLPHPKASDFERIFDWFNEESWRTEGANDVQGALRSYFATAELLRRENVERTERRRALHAQAPGFFHWFALWLDDNRAYTQACRFLRNIREELLAQNVDRGVLRACQYAALAERPDAKAFFPRVVDRQMHEVAAAHPAIVARIAAAIPAVLPPVSATEPDAVRRFGSPARPLEALAREPGLLVAMLHAVQNEWQCFEPAEIPAIMDNVQRRGRYFRHEGWKVLCESRDPRHKKVVGLIRAAREYSRLLRPITLNEFNPAAAFWPKVPYGSSYGWEPADVPMNLPSNTAAVSFDLPTHLAEDAGRRMIVEKRRLKVILRGHLPAQRGESLDKPLDVKAGLFQFRPDRREAVFGQHPAAQQRNMYVKPQSLRLMADSAGLIGVWSAMHMVETPLQVSKEQTLQAAMAPGKRLGVLLLIPGGSVLCDVLVFERTDEGLGWKLVSLEETRPRTDGGMRTGSARGNPQPWICKRRPFVRIDAAAIDFRFSQLVKAAEEKASSDVNTNRATTAWMGKVRSALGDTTYKQAAARIERLLAWNRCDGVLIAGGGSLRGRSGLQHPFNRFYNLRRRSGYLFNALNRLGLPWSAITGRYGRIWMRDYLRTPADVRELKFGYVFRRLRREEPGASDAAAEGRTTFGSLTHIAEDPSAKAPTDLALNAAWAATLAWSNPEFKKLAMRALTASMKRDEGSLSF